MDSRKDSEDDQQSYRSPGPRLDTSKPPTSHPSPDIRVQGLVRDRKFLQFSPLFGTELFPLSPVRRTLHSNSTIESGRPSLNSTNLDSDLALDENELSNKFKTLKIKISAWQCFINYDIDVTINIIKAHHVELKGEIHLLHHESILAQKNCLMTSQD